MSETNDLKLFHVNRALVHAELRAIEKTFSVDVLPTKPDGASDRDRTFYPQFPESLRTAAAEMAEHYEIFYCLENYIRDLVAERLEDVHGDQWWSMDDPRVIPDVVREGAQRNLQRETDAGITARSPEMIDYTTFGELGTIIEANWVTFGDLFNSRKGLMSILARLNLLRGPIAHCSALSEDEVLRLRLTLADFFRLMA